MRTCAYIFFLLFLFVGCDTAIDPVRKDTYSVYGYISPSADRQFIRVKPLEEPLRADANRMLDVTVTLQNVNTGTTLPLRDSVIVFADEGDSLVTHNFWTDADIQPETTYRLAVEGNNGVVTTAETTTPTGAPATASPQEGNCLTQFEVRFNEAVQAPVRLRGEFEYDGKRHQVPIDATVNAPEGADPHLSFVPETQLLDTRIPGTDIITIPFAPDLLPPRCLKLDSDTLEIGYVYASANWQEFNVDASDPLSFIEYVENSQINNGQGFFGALRQGKVTVTVDTSDTLQVDRLSSDPVHEAPVEMLPRPLRPAAEKRPA